MLFDLGNVVVRLNLEDFEREVVSRAGRIPDGGVLEYINKSGNVDKYSEGKLTSSQFYASICRDFKMDLKYGEFYRIWNSMFLPNLEAEKIIRTVREKYPDMKLVLLSNTNEAHFNFIRETYKILDLFDAFIVSHEVGRQKPHPAIYKEALKIAGTLPKETFYTDDIPSLVDAARVIGIRAFQYMGHEELKRQLSKLGVDL